MALEIIQALEMIFTQQIYIVSSTLYIYQHFLSCYLFLNIFLYFKIFLYFSAVLENNQDLHM